LNTAPVADNTFLQGTSCNKHLLSTHLACQLQMEILVTVNTNSHFRLIIRAVNSQSKAMTDGRFIE